MGNGEAGPSGPPHGRRGERRPRDELPDEGPAPPDKRPRQDTSGHDSCSSDAAFETASKQAWQLPHATTAQKLEIYGLFKQATVGDNETPQPSPLRFKEHAKWEAWSKVRGMVS